LLILKALSAIPFTKPCLEMESAAYREQDG
jgi:hypothetical protein